MNEVPLTEGTVSPRKELCAIALGWRLLPIAVFFIYLNLTWLVFRFGPWAYEMDSTWKLDTFIGCVHIALLLGYLSSFREKPAGCRYFLKPNTLVLWSALISIALLFPTSASRTGSLVPNVAKGLSDPGAAYAASQDLRNADTGAVEYLRILLGPILALYFPLLVFYWREIRLKTRIAGASAILGTVLLFISMGTNKAIADTVLLFPFLLLAAAGAKKLRLSTRSVLVASVFVLLGIGGFLAFFANTMATRSGSAAAAGFLPATGARADPDHFLVRNLSPEGKVAAYGISMYLSGGYYADYLSLREPFVWCYGFGNSGFLTRQVSRIFGWNAIESMPYPVRIEKYGWDSYGLWSSLYPWLASDLSFPGVVVFMFFVGRYFARSWLDTIYARNPFAIVAFANFLILLLYAPANNQLLQDGEGFTAAIGIFAIWLFTRRRVTGAGDQLLPR